MAETNPSETRNDPISHSARSEDDKVRLMVNEGEDQTETNQSQVQQKTLKASMAETPPNNAIPRNEGSFPEWLIKIMEEDEVAESNQSQSLKIPKVPAKLFGDKNKNKKCYSPLVVSIGPYHSNKQSEYWKSVKDKMVRQFVKESGKTIEEFYLEVKRVVEDEEAKGIYDQSSVRNISDEDFTKMMFIDGCFIAQFIYCVTSNYDQLEMSDQEVANVKRDLLLLENQLPYPFLDSLMKLGFKEETKKKFKKDWEKRFCLKEEWKKRVAERKGKGYTEERDKRFEEAWEKWFEEQREKMIDKFLEIQKTEKSFSMLDPLSFCCCFRSPRETLPPSAPKKKKGATGDKQQPAHLLEILYSRFIPKETEESVDSGRRGHYLYYTAKDLKQVGIHFRPSRTRALTDVKFSSFCFTGKLKLPPVTMDKSTKSKLLNLVAYESSAVPKKKLWVTSYLCLMDSLINDAQDVKELRSKGIVYNYLGHDGEVAKIFNQMTSSLELETSAYNRVKKDINKKCESESVYKICVALSLRFLEGLSG